MVATRRQVQNGPGEDVVVEQDPDQLLKKKAVRKPATKAAAPTTKTESKTRSVRGKKLLPEPGPEVTEVPTTRNTRAKKIAMEADVAFATELNAPLSRSAAGPKISSVRAKKALVALNDANEEFEVTGNKATKVTKTSSTRWPKPVATFQEPVEPTATQAVRMGTGPTRGSRIVSAASDTNGVALPPPKQTRSTRTTARSTPLSPKKITQISKAPTRSLKPVVNKATAKSTRSKTLSNTTSTGRKRTVSDENADAPDLVSALEDTDNDEEVVVLASTPKKVSGSSKRGARQLQAVKVPESEASMSSAPTTPTDSIIQSFDAAVRQADDHEDVASASETDSDNAEEANVSEDELCGPKTPMKRASPAAVARYQASVQRTLRKHEENFRVETPTARYAILGTQRGTPQSQKPYCKPAAPTPEARPMTLSHATNRPLVFKELGDTASASAGAEESYEGYDDEPSFLPDGNIIPMEMTASELNDSLIITQPQSVSQINEGHLVGQSLIEEDAEDYVVPANVQKYSDDPDDTVIINDDHENLQAPSELPVQPPETEGTVVITRAQSPISAEDTAAENESESESERDEASVIINSIQPQWNIERLYTAPIAVNFDEHFKDVRASPEKEFPYQGPGSASEVCMSGEQDVRHESVSEVTQDNSIYHDVSRRQTLDLDIFIDMGALTEPTMHMQLETDAPLAAFAENSLSVVEEKPARHALRPDEASGLDQPEQVSLFEDDLHIVQDVIAVRVDDASLIQDDDSDPNLRPDTAIPGDIEAVETPHVPHYALPTMAFDARRKSLPILGIRTPTISRARPNTSDGASIPRIANPFSNTWWARSGMQSATTTPAKVRPNADSLTTPTRPASSSDVASAVKTPKERYPLLSFKATPSEHRNTIAAPRFATPGKQFPKRRETFHKAVSGKTMGRIADSVPSTPAAAAAVTTLAERYPALRGRKNNEAHSRTVAGLRFQDPASKSENRRQTFHKALPGAHLESNATQVLDATTPILKTPRQDATVATPATASSAKSQDRYPRFKPRQNYEDHAKTIAGPKRFHTPVKRSLKRPATVGKSTSLRIAGLANKAPPSSRTPTRTLLQVPALTPSQAPMTPHPAAPLRGIMAIVEVFTLEGASASAPFISLLHRLGAKTTRSWTDRITHVVFKDGSPSTLQRVRLNNKDVEGTGKGSYIHCVNSRWVTDCDTEGVRVDESGDAYIVDVAEVPRGGKRRRKSMEPSALLNLGGNIVRERKISGSRPSSIGRSPLKFVESAAVTGDAAQTSTVTGDGIEKENSEDGQSSPATPAWIAAPEQLVQHTAPMKRVRKLDLPAKGEAKSRRLTFWNGAA